MRILNIEDEATMARVIQRGLTQAHFTVITAEDGAAGLKLARTQSFALIILDLMLPKVDGWRICEILREAGNPVPILMLTARGAIEERVRGLETGADDYLPKPFAFPEFLARVHALVRRDRKHKTRIIHVADLKIDTGQQRVWRADREIRLTHREYELLEALAAHEGKVWTREAIQERVWMDDESFSNTVDVHIGRLRKKIDTAHHTKLIHTLYGVGYVLRRPEEAQ
jgi:DNA-binding response OmpR family regulator